MIESSVASREIGRHRGWIVTFAGTGINLALGVLYAWSVVSKKIPAEWGWTEAQRSLPYSIACLVFALTMVPAGRLQDRMGPRLVASIGGLLVGAGMILAGLTTSVAGYVLGFGVLAGAGIGFGYASATPPAVKWFPSSRTGFIAGIVVAGFGLASVYVAPLANALIGTNGVPGTLMILGVAFLIAVVGLAQLLKPPPSDYVVEDRPSTARTAPMDASPGAMLRTWQFYAMWFMYACGAGAGLMIISKLAKLVEVQAGLAMGFALVAVLALGNGGGRIVAGLVSDRFGRKAQLVACFVVQAVLVFLLSRVELGSAWATPMWMALLSAAIGANYGAHLSLFPAMTKDYFGAKHFGANYGLVFTAWGLGGFSLSLLAGAVYDRTQSFAFAYQCSIALLLAAAATTALLRPPGREEATAEPELDAVA